MVALRHNSRSTVGNVEFVVTRGTGHVSTKQEANTLMESLPDSIKLDLL